MTDSKEQYELTPLDMIAEMLDDDYILNRLKCYKNTDSRYYLFDAFINFAKENYENPAECISDLSKAENGWEKGMPKWTYLLSAVMHYLKFRLGYTDDRHDRAFLWSIICLVWRLDSQ